MASTTATLSGVTINEVHITPAGAGQDINNDGIGNLNDEYIELVNTAGSSTDISGWTLYVSNSSVHTFAAATTLNANDRITVVDANGGGTIVNVAGDAVFSDFGMSLSADDSIILHDTGANEFIFMAGPDMTPTEISNDLTFFQNVISGGGTQIGPTENLASDISGQSHQRTVDGDDAWVTDAPNPGSPNCFAEGTLIATADGEVAVETLKQGDRVRTADGRTVPVLWVGRQTVMKRFWGERAAMVQIHAGAFGKSPHTDLVVTADHGMVLDGCVINAAALINGQSVEWVPVSDLPERYVVYHVETPGHEVIFANGAESESYLDIPGRRSFDNYAEYLARFGEDRPIREQRMPRIASARMLPLPVQLRMLV
ncbi:MAG: Hint domain-containing protein [Pseudomonadota bacterium]